MNNTIEGIRDTVYGIIYYSMKNSSVRECWSVPGFFSPEYKSYHQIIKIWCTTTTTTTTTTINNIF